MTIRITPMRAFDDATDAWSKHKDECAPCRNHFACADGITLRSEVLRLARLASAWADD